MTNSSEQLTQPVIDSQGGVDNVDVTAKQSVVQPLMTELYKTVQQEQSMVTPREVARQLDNVLAQYEQLAADFSDKHHTVVTKLAELKERGGEASAQLLKLTAQLSSQDESQRDAVEGVKSELKTAVSSLDGEITELTSFLNEQKSGLIEQRNRLDQFDITCELLDEATRGNRQRIETLKHSVEDKHRMLDTQLAGMDSLLKGHTLEIGELTETTELLTSESIRLENKIDHLGEVVAENVDLDRSRFKMTVFGLAFLCVLAIATISLFKWHPAFVPTTTQEELAAVDHRVAGVEDGIGQLPSKAFVTTQLEESNAALAETLDARQVVITGQVEEMNRSISEVEEMNRAISTESTEMARAIEDLRFEVRGSGSAGPALLTPTLPIEGIEWINSQNPAAYTVQILSVYSYDDMVVFSNQNKQHLSSETLSYTTSGNGAGLKRHYLNYGVYDTFSEAHNAIARFPLSVRVNQPWVRQVSSLQQIAK